MRLFCFLEVVETVLENVKNDSQPTFFAISGGPGLGKTTFCRTLASLLCSLHIPTLHFELDNFLISREAREPKKLTGCDPESYRWEKVHEALLSIEEGASFSFQPYSQKNGEIESKMKIVGGKYKVVLMDGVFSLHEKLSAYNEYGFFFESDKRNIKSNWINANLNYRGYSEEDVVERVDHCWDRYFNNVAPLKERADMVVVCDNITEQMPCDLPWWQNRGSC